VISKSDRNHGHQLGVNEENFGSFVADFSQDPGNERKRRKNVAGKDIPAVNKGINTLGG
jgi:hypothetical protein